MRKFDKVQSRAKAHIATAVDNIKEEEFTGKNITEQQEKDIYQRAIIRILSMDKGDEGGQVIEDFKKLSLDLKKLCQNQSQYKFTTDAST